jgi:hypothetical protein
MIGIRFGGVSSRFLQQMRSQCRHLLQVRFDARVLAGPMNMSAEPSLPVDEQAGLASRRHPCGEKQAVQAERDATDQKSVVPL